MKFVSIITILAFSFISKAQKEEGNIKVVGSNSHFTNLWIHSDDLNNLRGAKPYGQTVNFAWLFNQKKIWDAYNCFPKLGLLLSYWTFDNRIVAEGYYAQFYIEPFHPLNQKLHFSYRFAIGLSHLTNPFHEINNPTNQVYGANLGYPLAIGIGLNYQISNQWIGKLHYNFNHVSNGRKNLPNTGMNYPGISIGIDYAFKPVKLEKKAITKFDPEKQNNNQLHLFLYESSYNYLDKNYLAAIGMELLGYRQFRKMHAFSYGLDFTNNKLLKDDRIYNKTNDENRYSFGLSIGHALLIGQFIINQQFGFYLHDAERPEEEQFFQRYGITYNMYKNIYVGFSLKAFRGQAKYLDYRIGYRLW